MSSQIFSIQLNKWALEFEFRKCEKKFFKDLSNDGILQIFDTYFES